MHNHLASKFYGHFHTAVFLVRILNPYLYAKTENKEDVELIDLFLFCAFVFWTKFWF